jgi:hypothetical protein
MKITEIAQMNTVYGNPQLGKADPNNPHPAIYDKLDGNIIGHLSICHKCGGYYWIECPCLFRHERKQ